MAIKYSRQREAIKEFMMTRKDHPTADIVYMNVRKEFPNTFLVFQLLYSFTLLIQNSAVSKIQVLER